MMIELDHTSSGAQIAAAPAMDLEAAKALAQLVIYDQMDKCPYYHPRSVLQWLRKHGHIECRRSHWVREQGLDFVEDFRDRNAAKKLADYRDFPIMDKCPYSSPVDVLKWLRKHGHIECKRSHWVREQGLDFVPSTDDRKAAKAAKLGVCRHFRNSTIANH